MAVDWLPEMPAPWRLPVPMPGRVQVDVAVFTDPLCPWAYSFEPVLRTLESRYGDQLRVRTVLIGLLEQADQAVARGATPASRARSHLQFRRLGMPITPLVRARVLASGPACRLVIAAEQQVPGAGDALLRQLRIAWFTTDLILDERSGLAAVAGSVFGLDADAALRAAEEPPVLEMYEAGRAEARAPARRAVTIGRTARTDGSERYTAPTLVFVNEEGRRAIVPGFQPFEAAEVALLNLEPRLARRPPPSVEGLLSNYPGGLTSVEVARALADTTDVPDRSSAEHELTDLAGAGRAERVAIGDDALWRPR